VPFALPFLELAHRSNLEDGFASEGEHLLSTPRAPRAVCISEETVDGLDLIVRSALRPNVRGEYYVRDSTHTETLPRLITVSPEFR